ncbi:restriction endonuclease subunit S [Idiomarina sp. ST10R2A5]|uniref:restriction endonuclease subunit S n=1 Tax=Idiomarina sp. ST10R2A5 TaxID=3418368 RepID=UPI003EC8AF4C
MLSEVPEGWSEKELEQLLSVSTPGFWGKEAGVEDTDILVLRATNFTKGGIRYETAALRSFPNKKIEQKKLEKGDLLLERSGGSAAQPVGRIRYFDAEGAYSFSNFFQLLRVDEAQVRSHYTYYMLDHFYENGDTVQLQKATTGIRNLAYKDYLSTKFLVPPLTEQKRIAEVLSSVDESIQATQRLIEQAERVKQGLMEELLTGGLGSEAIERGEVPEGWQSLTAKDLAEVKGLQTGPFGSQLKANEHIEVEEQGACRVIMPKNIKNGQIDFESASIITADKATDLAKHALEMGDVLFARRGDLSKVAIYYGAKESICGTGCLRLRPKKELVNTHFLRFLFTNHKAIDWLHANAVGATMLNLNTQIIGRLPVLLPPIKQQEEIANALMALEDFCFQHEVRLSSFAKLKKGLMDDLLTGKVRTV